MSNMSYCRFTNTHADIVDCLDALREETELSDFEARAAKKLFSSFLEFCEENEIIESYDEDAVKAMIDALSE